MISWLREVKGLASSTSLPNGIWSTLKGPLLYNQVAITRSEELPYACVRTSLFLEQFWLEYRISEIPQTSQQNLQTYGKMIFFAF